MRSFTLLSIELAILLMSLTLFLTLNVDPTESLIEYFYRYSVDIDLSIHPTIDIPPFIENKVVLESIGFPSYPGRYFIEASKDVLIYLIDEEGVKDVFNQKVVELDKYVYLLAVAARDASPIDIVIRRLDNDVSLMILILALIGILLTVLGGLGWSGSSRLKT